MDVIQKGRALAWGVPLVRKIIVGIPPEAIKVRLRYRTADAVRCYVKTPSGISEHYLFDSGDCWKLGPPIAENKTA
jgi:hypothetical protein